MPRPAFVALDGLDGTGKSTQHLLLDEWLTSQKIPHTLCNDPGSTSLGLKLREILLFGREHAMANSAEAMLFMAARAQMVEEVIRPALDRNEVVVSDRFGLANIVYQGHAGGMNTDDLWKVGLVATGGLEPDLTIVFDLPDIDMAIARRKREGDRLEERDRDYQSRVCTGFRYEAGRRPDRFRLIDASTEIETVHRLVRREVGRLLTDFGWHLSPEG